MLCTAPHNLAGVEEKGSSRQPAVAAPDLLPPGVLLGALLPLVQQLSTCLRAHVQAEQQTERLPLINQRATLKPPWDDRSILHPSQHMYKDSKSQDTFLVSIHIKTYRNIAQ